MKTTLNKKIRQYIAGKSSNGEKERFKKKINRDPFLADAVDGYKMFPEMLKQNSYSLARKGNSVATLIFILIGISWIGLWWLNFDPNSNNQTVEIKEKATINLPKEDMPAIEPIEKIQPFISIDEPFKELKSTRSFSFMQKIPLKDNYSIDIETIGVYRTPIFRNKAIYIHNLKVIVVDTLSRTPLIVIPEHLPAKWESERQFNGSKRIYEPQIETRHYMDTPLLLFQKGKYSQSLLALEKANDRLPGNLNIHFYRALCYYHLEDYHSALYYFKKTQRIPFQGFYEEARWYEALCLEKSDNLTLAKKVYAEILEKNGFYAIRAASRLALLSESE